MTRLTARNVELADAESIAAFRRMTDAQKVRTMSGMYESARRWVSSAVRQDHPDWPEDRRRAEVNRRMRGEVSRDPA